ncbi:ankyrin repeat domain-containing protein [Arenimonas sp.]|uniref:ankyrin repeat domain-containing protein n=1 Tax=Arenimonas sp. TaxID=1872635 RepID=UPI0039E4D4DF
MPAGVDRLKEAIRDVVGVERWFDLSNETLQLLLDEGFKPRSLAGAQLLTRAMCNHRTLDEPAAALERLVQLGAADIELESDGLSNVYGPDSHLENALFCQRGSLVAPMLARGALMTNGVPDQAKLDRAFWIAIVSRLLPQARLIWDAVPGLRPQLRYPDTSKKVAPLLSVVYLLGEWNVSNENNGAAMAQWLASLGADIRSKNAAGETLLHMAADKGDAELVRWLLEQGLSPNAADEDGRPAVVSAEEETTVMLLLDAGSVDEKFKPELKRRAEKNAWRRVLAWLDASKP